MALNLYRRHRRDCKAGHPEEFLNSEFDERKKGWKRCECHIFASGTLSGTYRRKSTTHWQWDQARAAADSWERAGTWNGQVRSLPDPIPEPTHHRSTVEHATKVFLDELQETAAHATHKKYRLLMQRLKKFSDQRGYLYIDQWDVTDVRSFRSTWPVSGPTAVRRMAMLKPFFEYCLSNKWIESNPARAIKNPKTRDSSERAEQKLPFSDDEIKRMYEACQNYPTDHRHKWTGDDIADFISISIYTGLRISDVALFRADRMLPTGEIRLRTTKAGTHVYTWVPKWLQERIRARQAKHGDFIFGQHITTSLDVITELWRRKLNKIWEKCGPWKNKPTPHRFRHTFARILLQKPGVTVRDVAELLGNTEEVILKYYGAWVIERQARLTRILKDAFEDRPKPKLLRMP